MTVFADGLIQSFNKFKFILFVQILALKVVLNFKIKSLRL